MLNFLIDLFSINYCENISWILSAKHRIYIGKQGLLCDVFPGLLAKYAVVQYLLLNSIIIL